MGVDALERESSVLSCGKGLELDTFFDLGNNWFGPDGQEESLVLSCDKGLEVGIFSDQGNN